MKVPEGQCFITMFSTIMVIGIAVTSFVFMVMFMPVFMPVVRASAVRSVSFTASMIMNMFIFCTDAVT